MLGDAVARSEPPPRVSLRWRRLLDAVGMPLLAVATALILGALVIWLTSGRFATVLEAYGGLLDGALLKPHSLSESLVATIPYVLASLAVALGFKAGLFNIGVEGQFYLGAVSVVWAGTAFSGLPAVLYLPLALAAGAAGGAVWGAIPGVLKVRTGAHEVITTIMLNYVAFRLAEYLVSGPLRDRSASAVQTVRVARDAELWALWEIPQRLQDPLNRVGLGILIALIAVALIHWGLTRSGSRPHPWRTAWAAGLAVGALGAVVLPPLFGLWWPFADPYDRLHVGLLLALGAAAGVWWLLERTTIGFELRTVGANPHAARFAGIDVGRTIVLAMTLSGALAGLAGAVEVLGVSICSCLPLFFSRGYGFDSIAIAVLAQANPLGILPAAFLFGAMRNGADLMELRSGVSKDVISLIQALVLLFVAAPAIVRWLYRIRGEPRPDESVPLMRGWGG